MSTVKTRGLRIVTYNIHKGFSQFNRYMMLHELREQLRLLDADIMFLQEVQGEHSLHAARFDNWPAAPQHDFLAADVWQATAYACNVVYDHGHHGNAILSRFPIGNSFNQDVTHLRFERRGLLHCRIDVPEWQTSVHCVCVHLSLFARSRRRQMDALATYLEGVAGTDSPHHPEGSSHQHGGHAAVEPAQAPTGVFGVGQPLTQQRTRQRVGQVAAQAECKHQRQDYGKAPGGIASPGKPARCHGKRQHPGLDVEKLQQYPLPERDIQA